MSQATFQHATGPGQGDSLSTRTTLPVEVCVENPNLSYEELLRAYNELREETGKRTVALASAAHELKTPLSIMAGYLELLLSQRVGPLSDRQAQVLSAMQASSLRLKHFTEDFLEYCAMETGKVTPSFQIGDLNECLSEVFNTWLVRFQSKGVALYFPVGADLPEFAFDYHKVQRVTANLIENAFLSTPPGGSVWLIAELHYWERRTRQMVGMAQDQRRQSSSRPNSVRITVADTGPGIAPEFHEEIFGDFVSFRSADKNAPSSGLGLAIARRLVVAQQGKIWVESDAGAGSRFCFLLPLRPVQQ